jgi:hypothetical protein
VLSVHSILLATESRVEGKAGGGRNTMMSRIEKVKTATKSRDGFKSRYFQKDIQCPYYGDVLTSHVNIMVMS